MVGHPLDSQNQKQRQIDPIVKTPGAGTCEYISAASLSPCTIIIFGASGDLTSRKLLPAFFNLFQNNYLPEPVSIVGCARTPLSDLEFKEKLKIACSEAGCIDHAKWDKFAARLHYRPIVYDSPSSYIELAKFLRELDKQKHTLGNRLFYLAIPPSLYPGVSEMIGKAGLAAEGKHGNGWSRIVVEKPFGRNLQTALELDRILHRNFQEHQIFRIDHYLAKETVQNILMFRFANTIFEPVWNRSYIEYVGIIAGEKLGVEHRAGYYEQAGVLRDMFQNHMMQLVALTAMEPPSRFEADRVRDEKVKTYRSFKPFNILNKDEHLILGQYGPGSIDGEPVPGYRTEKGVNSGSLTPTFAMMRLYIDNWRWRGVPFYLASGKRLQKKVTRIVVQFKEVPHSMFRHVLGEHIIANRLILGVYPDEKITLTFQTKQPGAQTCLRPVTMDFKYNKNAAGPAMEAYEKVLLDCILGDHMLFWRQDGVELCWSFLSPILAECKACADQTTRLYPYEAGSWGPQQAEEWIKMIVD